MIGFMFQVSTPSPKINIPETPSPKKSIPETAVHKVSIK